MEAIEFVLKTDLLPVINKLAGDQGNPLSPWNKGEIATEVAENDWQRLKEAGLSDTQGQLKEEVTTVLDKLSRPVRMLRLRLVSGGAAMEHMVYYCQEGREAISLTSKDDSLRFRAPAPLELIFDGFLEYWGGSGLVSSGLKSQLVPGEAMVLAAMIDLRRRQVLSDISSMNVVSEISSYDAKELKNTLELKNNDAQWLVVTIKSLTGLEDIPPTDKIEETLESLAQKELVEKTEEKFKLTQDSLALANNFLLISQVLRLETFMLEKDSIVRSSMLCLQAGIHDNLYIDQEEDQILIKAVSAQLVAEMIATFLSEEFKSEVTQEETSSISWFMLKESQQYGPYSWEDLQGYIAEGRLSGEDLVWHEGLSEWTQFSQVNN